jgi:hypothetical protein
VLVYPFSELTRLYLKKVPQWSLLLHFFRLSKYEKPSSLPSLGLLKLHQRTLPLCVLLITFSYLCLWPNASSMLLSTKPSKTCLIRKPCNTLPLHLDTLAHGGISRVSFSYIYPFSLSIHVFLILGTSMSTTLDPPL